MTMISSILLLVCTLCLWGLLYAWKHKSEKRGYYTKAEIIYLAGVIMLVMGAFYCAGIMEIAQTLKDINATLNHI